MQRLLLCFSFSFEIRTFVPIGKLRHGRIGGSVVTCLYTSVNVTTVDSFICFINSVTQKGGINKRKLARRSANVGVYPVCFASETGVCFMWYSDVQCL